MSVRLFYLFFKLVKQDGGKNYHLQSTFENWRSHIFKWPIAVGTGHPNTRPCFAAIL
jgi:hypothetical protein